MLVSGSEGGKSLFPEGEERYRSAAPLSFLLSSSFYSVSDPRRGTRWAFRHRVKLRDGI
jgi:hypothetical protein